MTIKRERGLSEAQERRNGAGDVKLQEREEPVISMVYNVAWEQQYLDLKELARLYWIENWKLNKLTTHFGISRNAMKDRLRRMKQRPDLVREFAPNMVNGGSVSKRSKA